MPQLDDILIEEAKEDPSAFAELVSRYQDRLYNFLYRMTGSREDAQDLAQETFLRIYKALARFRQGSPFSPWMYKIAVNLAINHRKSRRPTEGLEEDFASTNRDGSPEEYAERREAQQRIHSAIQELPAAYRAVVILRHMDELSYDEIAQALDIPLGTAKVRLHRARLMLQEKLNKNGQKNTEHELHDSQKTHSSLS